MRKKQLIVLIIILAVIVAAIAGVFAGKQAKEQKEKEAEEAETVSVHPFDTGEVTAFTYLIDDQLAMFSLEDGTWLYMTDTTWQIDAGKVENFLEEMSGITANAVVENAEDTSEYGLDDPTQMFAVVLSDGSSLTYLFGSENEVLGGTYLQVTDDADEADNQKVYLVDSSIVSSTLAKSAESFQVEESGDSAAE